MTIPLRFFPPKALMAAVAICLFSSCMPKCPINSCQTRMVHRHGEQQFRGMPWYKKQNPRIGEKLPKKSKEVKEEMYRNDSGKKGKN
ncbi:hypothetical protein FHS90_002095 [Rufibacter quisquiliarum]|uniref:Lipoprotein n=1 Tax=Rufibacter quisquiliarum TaxID=1549639 RepID=A0A839GEP1_9BACT|nr:hypothetical protein [Rufibacter quisquiliarum]